MTVRSSDPHVLRDARGRYLSLSGTLLKVLRTGERQPFSVWKNGVPGHGWESDLFYATACPRPWLERYAARVLKDQEVEVLPVVVVRGHARFVRT